MKFFAPVGNWMSSFALEQSSEQEDVTFQTFDLSEFQVKKALIHVLFDPSHYLLVVGPECSGKSALKKAIQTAYGDKVVDTQIITTNEEPVLNKFASTCDTDLFLPHNKVTHMSVSTESGQKEVLVLRLNKKMSDSKKLAPEDELVEALAKEFLTLVECDS